MTEEAPAPRPFPWRALAVAGLVALLLVMQYSLFRRHARREVVWAYPDHYDQAGYLSLTYSAYEGYRTEGFLPVLRRELCRVLPTGVLFPVEGSLFLVLLGPTRLSALTMHFAHFALLQVCLFVTLSWVTRRYSAGWLGLGLLMAALTPFAQSGGMFDYRIDFSAACLYGVMLCLVVRSRLFASWQWSALTGVAGSWTVLCRSLTVLYVVGTAGAFFLYLCLRWWRGDAETRRQAVRQVGGLLVAAAVLAGLASFFFWNNGPALYDYYGINHLLGAQADFRNRGMGILTVFDSVSYYPWAIAQQHLGLAFLGLLGGLLVAAIVLRRLTGPAGTPAAETTDRRGLLVFLLLGLAVPYTMMNLDTVKNPAVAGIVVPPLVWLAALGVMALARIQFSIARPRAVGVGLAAVAVAAVVVGSGNQLIESRQPGQFTWPRKGYTRVGELYDAIAEHCREMHWTEPRVAATCLETDYFQPVVMVPYIYERHHVIVQPRTYRMGGSWPWAITEDQVKTEVSQSDIVILVDPASAPSSYPFDQSIREMFPRLKAFCDQTMTPLRRLQIWHFDVVVYTRPAPKRVATAAEEAEGGAAGEAPP